MYAGTGGGRRGPLIESGGFEKLSALIGAVPVQSKCSMFDSIWGPNPPQFGILRLKQGTSGKVLESAQLLGLRIDQELVHWLLTCLLSLLT